MRLQSSSNSFSLGGIFKDTTLVFILIFGIIPMAVLAYQNPGAPKGAVNDFAGMLSPNEVVGLETKLENFNKATGNAIIIAMINSLNGDTIENFAAELFKEWGIGDEKKTMAF